MKVRDAPATDDELRLAKALAEQHYRDRVKWEDVFDRNRDRFIEQARDLLRRMRSR